MIDANALRKFDADLKKFSRTVGVETDKVTRRTALSVFRYLIRVPLVDTGRFRGSWTINYDSPVDAEIPARPEGERGRIPAASASQLGPVKPFGPIYIHNDVPYAEALNDNGGKQVGPFFIQTAIDQAISELTGAL